MNLNATLFAQMIVFFVLWWVVARFVWPPLVKALDERSSKIVDLESNIKQKLYGQDSAVDSVLERVYINFSGIGNEKKPIASFLFLGPTGTGKTELAKLLASNLDMQMLKYLLSLQNQT